MSELSWTDLIGYAASASVLATFCMRTIMPLRVVAIGSNALFATYGALAHIHPVLLLHVVLLPINITRLIQAMHLSRAPGCPVPPNVTPNILEFGKPVTHAAALTQSHCIAAFMLKERRRRWQKSSSPKLKSCRTSLLG